MTRPVFYNRRVFWTDFRESRSKRLGSWSNVLDSIGGKFQNGGNDTTREAFLRKRGAAEDGLHSLLTMNNEMSKRGFTEELSFETEVAQTDVLSTILLFSCSFSSLNSSDKSDFSKSFEISLKT